MPEPILGSAGLDAFHDDFHALLGLDIHVAEGEVLAIIGANGAGKTTLLRSVAGLIRNGAAQICFRGAPIGALRADHVAGLGIALAPEGRRLFPSLSVEENLLIDGRIGRAGPWSLAAVYALFPVLRERRAQPATSLSGGQQQMVAIERALMADPDPILFDEISLGLAPIVIRDICAALPGIVGGGASAVIVEQDIGKALRCRRGRSASRRGVCRWRGYRAGSRATTSAAPISGSHDMDWLNALVPKTVPWGRYALFVAGLSLIFGVMRLVNIAHGDLIVLAAYLGLTTSVVPGLHPLAALLIIVPAMAGIGYALQRDVLNRTLSDDTLPPLLVAFGLSVILQNALMEGYTVDPQKMDAGALETASFGVGGLSLGVLPVLTFAVAVIAALQWVLYRTPSGRAFRATSDNQDIAQLMGLNKAHMFGLAMALSLAVVAIAGIFLGIRSSFDPSIGGARLIFGFEAEITGGLGNLWGTLAGAVTVGVAQPVGAKIDPGWQLLAGHLVFLLILAVRPNGLFPRVSG